MEQPSYYLDKAIRAEVEAANASTLEFAQTWVEVARSYRAMAASAVRAERAKATQERSNPTD